MARASSRSTTTATGTRPAPLPICGRSVFWLSFLNSILPSLPSVVAVSAAPEHAARIRADVHEFRENFPNG